MNIIIIKTSSSSPSYNNSHRVIILLERACLHNRIGRNWCKFSRPECATSQSDVSQLKTARSLANGPNWGGGGWGRSMYSAFPDNSSVSNLTFVYGRSLWAELNGGENSLHWKANMLPLFSIMTVIIAVVYIFMYLYFSCPLYCSYRFNYLRK